MERIFEPPIKGLPSEHGMPVISLKIENFVVPVIEKRTKMGYEYNIFSMINKQIVVL